MPNKYDDDYTRVNWENLPSHNTPLNQQNLNKMDAQIKTLTTRVSDMSTYVPNVMYVDELPEQGVEGLLYVTALIEHGFELDGLPERYQSQSALDTWINQGNFAFMLHLSSTVTDDTYAIIENVLVQTVTSLPDTYSVSEMNGNVTTYYLYDPDTKTWDSSTYGTLSVDDILVGIGQVNLNSKLPSHYYATGGDISDNLGIENIIGDVTISSHISHYTPTITYTSSDNTYEIYQAKPIQVLDPRNVYMWNDDTHSFFGFQKEYENGNGIVFTNQGTKVIISTDTTVLQEKLIEGQNIRIVGNVISATGGGGGGGSDVISPLYYKVNNTWYCTKTYDELIQYLPNDTMSDIYATPVIPQAVGDFGAYDRYSCYYISTYNNVITTRYRKWYWNGNLNKYDELIIAHNSNDQITVTSTGDEVQRKLREGDGISISANGTISVNYPNGDTIAY